MEIKIGVEIENELIKAQEYGTEDNGVLLKELESKKWASLEDLYLLFDKFDLSKYNVDDPIFYLMKEAGYNRLKRNI